MRWSTHRLSSVPASTYMFVESSDSWSSRSAIVAMANQPKICCAHDSAIEIAAFRTGRVQHASSRMPFALQNPTQHSSERNIGRHMLRATYGDIAIVPIRPPAAAAGLRFRPEAGAGDCRIGRLRPERNNWGRQRCRSLIAMLERRSRAGQMSGTWRGAQREKTARCGIASCCRRKAGRTGQHRYRRAIGEERGSRRRPLAPLGR